MGFKNTWKAGWGYIASVFHKRKETNLENFYINRFGKPLYEMFFKDYTTKVWGVSPSEISADWGAQRVKGLSLSKAVWEIISKPFKKLFHSKKVETSLIEEFYYPKFGPGQLYETMAKRISEMGGKILFNHEVSNIAVENGAIAYVEAKNGDSTVKFTADDYISSMANKDLYYAFGDNYANKEAYEVAKIEGNELAGLDIGKVYITATSKKDTKVSTSISINVNHVLLEEENAKAETKTKPVVRVTQKDMSAYDSICDFVYQKMTVMGAVDRYTVLTDKDLKTLKKLINEEQARRKGKK